ncbi:reverse transcriptase-rnase h-integrase [Moniliophthora roreri]|nr:reverse transcriptase-rnase h-integrase [Moniliophthora roreri]
MTNPVMLQKMILNADGSELEDISILLSGRHAILKTFLSKKCGHTVFQLQCDKVLEDLIQSFVQKTKEANVNIPALSVTPSFITVAPFHGPADIFICYDAPSSNHSLMDEVNDFDADCFQQTTCKQLQESLLHFAWVHSDKKWSLTDVKGLGTTNYQNTTPPRAPFTAAEEADLDDQLEVAEQLLNSDPKQTLRRITRSQRRGAVESLQTERTETEAKSSETDPFDEYRNIFHTPTPEMTTPSGSTAAADVKLKVEHDDTDEQWARTISTAVLQTIDDKKDEASKGPTPDPFLGKQSDTRRFLLDLELYFAMNPVKANTDEKKKMLLLSLVKGNTSEWKQRETMKLFPEDDDPEEKKKAAEETWSSFKQRFRNEWQPVNVVREAQTKIEQIRMTDRADEYVNRFRLIAMDTKYDDEALMRFFREGLLESLQTKIML